MRETERDRETERECILFLVMRMEPVKPFREKKMGSDDILNEKDLSYNKWKTNQISFPIELIHGNTLGLSFIFSGQRMFLPVP